MNYCNSFLANSFLSTVPGFYFYLLFCSFSWFMIQLFCIAQIMTFAFSMTSSSMLFVFYLYLYPPGSYKKMFCYQKQHNSSIPYLYHIRKHHCSVSIKLYFYSLFNCGHKAAFISFFIFKLNFTFI